MNLPSSAIYTLTTSTATLTSERGTRSFTRYDDENRVDPGLKWSVFLAEPVRAYDGKMRRRITKEFTWQNSVLGSKRMKPHYVYDGNVGISRSGDINDLPQVAYTRGNDLERQPASARAALGAFVGLLSTLKRQPSTLLLPC